MKSYFSENRHLIFAVLGIAVGFVFGFRVANKHQPLALKYNTPIIPYEQTLKSTKAETESQETPSQKNSGDGNVNSQKDCLIKGNSNSKIYHIPGGAFYERMKTPECFESEEAAKKAGYRRSGR